MWGCRHDSRGGICKGVFLAGTMQEAGAELLLEAISDDFWRIAVISLPKWPIRGTNDSKTLFRGIDNRKTQLTARFVRGRRMNWRRRTTRRARRLSLSLSHRHYLTHTHTHSLSHTHTHTHTHSHTHTHTLTHPHTHTHTLSHSHTHTHTLSLSLSLTHTAGV